MNPGLIPSQRDQMSKKIFLILIKSIFQTLKRWKNSHGASCLLFKYYISVLGGVLTLTQAGGGGPKLWKTC